jgi:hypothetical protein
MTLHNKIWTCYSIASFFVNFKYNLMGYMEDIEEEYTPMRFLNMPICTVRCRPPVEKYRRKVIQNPESGYISDNTDNYSTDGGENVWDSDFEDD